MEMLLLLGVALLLMGTIIGILEMIRVADESFTVDKEALTKKWTERGFSESTINQAITWFGPEAERALSMYSKQGGWK